MAAKYLRQSTAAQVVTFGPCVDKTDGVTAETGLVSAFDHASTGIMVSKNGGALAIRHATVTATIHDARGNYRVTLDATDTDTCGRLRVEHADAAMCPVWEEFAVLPAQVYDSLILGTDLLDANASQLGGTAQTSRDLGTSVLLSPGTGTGQVSITAGVVSANLAQILGTALTETAGQLAAAFKKFFNVADTNVPTAAAVALEATSQSILTDTAEIGVAGAGLTAIPTVDISAADIRAALGLASANMDTQLAALAALLGTPAGASLAADIAAIVTSALTEAQTIAAVREAIRQYDLSVSTSLSPAAILSVGGLVGAVTAPGPRPRKLVSTLFDEVRGGIHGSRSATLYPPATMVIHYNRILTEIWPILVVLGAEIVHGIGSLIADGLGQDYELPSDFNAFAPNGFLPRSPVNATADYGHAAALDHVGIFDRRMTGGSTRVGAPTCFAIFTSGASQYMRFNCIPTALNAYDFIYYPATPEVAVATIGSTYTPWLGLADELIKRTLEEICREGLEFTTGKREIWRARAEADLALTLGLRHLEQREVKPSIWASGPRR